MNGDRLKDLAATTGIPLKQLATWHYVHGPRIRPQRIERPDGTLSVCDIAFEYGVTRAIVLKWRKAGLKSRQKGKLILIRREDLERWMKKHPIVRRPNSRWKDFNQ